MSVDDVIVADRLTKSYGTSRGVRELSFTVHAGEVFGFLGPNGAGKSTTIRTMLDFIRPTSGSAVGVRARTAGGGAGDPRAHRLHAR